MVTCSTNLPSYGSSNSPVTPTASQKWAAGGCDIGAPALARSALSAAPSHQQIASRYRAQYLSVLARCGGEIVGLAGVGREPPYRPALLLTLVLKVVIGGVRL